jgi:hypothetical protein
MIFFHPPANPSGVDSVVSVPRQPEILELVLARHLAMSELGPSAGMSDKGLAHNDHTNPKANNDLHSSTIANPSLYHNPNAVDECD